MTKTRSTILALIAILLAPMVAHADLIEVAFTGTLSSGTGHYYDINTGQYVNDGTIIITYLFDTNDLPADQDSSDHEAWYEDPTNSQNWLTATLAYGEAGVIADQGDVVIDEDSWNEDILYIVNDYGRQALYMESETDPDPDTGGYFRASSYWTAQPGYFDDTLDWGCIDGVTIYDVDTFCDTTGLEVDESWLIFAQWDADGNLLADAMSQNVTSVAINRVSVPEPGTLALFVIGLGGIGLARRRPV